MAALALSPSAAALAVYGNGSASDNRTRYFNRSTLETGMTEGTPQNRSAAHPGKERLDMSRLLFTPSIAGVWQFVNDNAVTASNSGSLANSYYGIVHLGASQLPGLLMTGWQYSGFDNTSDNVIPVSIGILAQQADGTLKLSTQDYVTSPVTNGGGSVITADFNGDGRDDVFLAAHNESPFKQTSSVALLSNAHGGFTRLDLTDSVMAHDAKLAQIGGQPAVITSSFSEDYSRVISPLYLWNGSGFTVTQNALRASSGAVGMSAALADLNGDGTPEMVVGDLLSAPGYPYSASNKFKIGIFGFANNDITGPALAILIPYFESRPEYGQISSAWGPANTHSYRTWIDDFNHDGQPDIVVGQSLWNQANDNWPSMLQMLQNKGNFQFADVSDALNPEFDKDSGEIDYNMQIVDLDASGIASYLSGGKGAYDVVGGQWLPRDGRHNNFLMVNDGTGRLHVVLHDEFIALGHQVTTYANQHYHDPQTLHVNPNQSTPKFVGYQTATGELNFAVEVSAIKMLNGIGYANSSVIVNVPLKYNLRIDYTDAITIADRNGSHLMRTFAGNDRIHDSGHADDATIDGGLGIDTAIYGGSRAGYTMRWTGLGCTVTTSGLHDTLRNFERLEFANCGVALDMGADEHGGKTALLMAAVLGVGSLTAKKELAGVVIDLFDQGFTMSDLSGAVMRLPIWVDLTGGASSAQIANFLLTNVLGTAPDADTLAAGIDLIDHGTQGAFLQSIAESAQNQAHIGLVGLAQTGFEFG